MSKEIMFPDPYWLLTEPEEQEIEFVIVITATCLQEGYVQRLKQCLDDNGVAINSASTLSNNSGTEFSIRASTQRAWGLFQKLLTMAVCEDFDVAVLPASTRKKKLMICDMDSTIVASETLDDIAERIGIGEQVSQITERAMRGELDFRQALEERVILLRDVSEDVFDEIAKTVRFNPGAETLLKVSKQNEIRTVLVSGGFEPIVKVVAEKLGFDRYVCNRMQINDGKLSGKVLEPIVDASTKLQLLKEECQLMSIKPEQACCIGDGANDLPMLQAAGLGIGFQGKPLLRASIPYQLNSSGLDSVLLMMGIAE
jgi:phosphoserine phosphatase